MQPDVMIEENVGEMDRSQGTDGNMKLAEQRQEHIKDT